VAYEPNWIVTHQAEANDPYYTGGNLWGTYGNATSPANQYGSQAGEAWAAGNTGSPDVVVGVIDEGIDISHPDLANNIWVNPGEVAGNRVDDDKNGFVDDVNGWDFASNNASVYDGTGDDHGTHVAGTIAGIGGNGRGVAGMAWNATLIPVKFLGANGGTTANAIKAVDYLTDLKTRHDIDLVASNNSWGGGGFTQSLKDAIGRADSAGILFVAAAGNDSADNDATVRYPSGYKVANIIAVASIDKAGALSSFSNYGATTVDLGAPGSGIYSTLPGGAYGSYNGTSMATPHVTGGVVLAAAAGTSGAANLKNAILETVVPTPSLSGKTVKGGRLDVSRFGAAIAPVTNTAPVAVDDGYKTTQGTTLTVEAPGVLGNDSDAEGDGMTATVVTPANGTVTLEPTGRFVYTPNNTFTGTDSFTYKAHDGELYSAPATVTITVTKAKGGGKPARSGSR
jgi:subtilisin family serine protease